MLYINLFRVQRINRCNISTFITAGILSTNTLGKGTRFYKKLNLNSYGEAHKIVEKEDDF